MLHPFNIKLFFQAYCSSQIHSNLKCSPGLFFGIYSFLPGALLPINMFYKDLVATENWMNLLYGFANTYFLTLYPAFSNPKVASRPFSISNTFPCGSARLNGSYLLDCTGDRLGYGRLDTLAHVGQVFF